MIETWWQAHIVEYIASGVVVGLVTLGLIIWFVKKKFHKE